MNEAKNAGLPPTGMSGRFDMRAPDEVSAMLALKSCGWGTKRIAAELGCSRNTVKRWIAEGVWREMALVSRRKSLDGLEDWVAGRFRQHAGQRRCRAPGARRGEGCRGEPAHGGAGGGASATGVASGSGGGAMPHL